ncbi:MAG: hypothetical protein M3238_03620, partial [Actinomycetota bacterium]|nr:hypothetical protein [Actinomycetota bacterium]
MHARAAVGVAVLAAWLMISAVPAVGNESSATNDDFATATVINEVPFAETVDLTTADVEVEEPQAACRTAQRTVWYAFHASENVNLVAEASSTFRSVLAVYSGSFLGDLTEVGCSADATHPKVEFKAEANNTYFMQLGASGRRSGLADFRLEPSAWQEKNLMTVEVPVDVPAINQPIVMFDGRPRAADPTLYDLTVGIADQQSIKRGVLTFGLVQERVHAELLQLPRQTASVVVKIGYRYDASQYHCLSDGGEGSNCTVNSPIKDIEWLTNGEGSRAELIITVRATKDDTVLAERTVTVPFLGQVAGLP